MSLFYQDLDAIYRDIPTIRNDDVTFTGLVIFKDAETIKSNFMNIFFQAQQLDVCTILILTKDNLVNDI